MRICDCCCCCCFSVTEVHDEVGVGEVEMEICETEPGRTISFPFCMLAYKVRACVCATCVVLIYLMPHYHFPTDRHGCVWDLKGVPDSNPPFSLQ